MRSIGFYILSMVLLLPSFAAAEPTVLQLAPGRGGPEGQNGGPGNEQASVAQVTVNGVSYVVTVYMSSDVRNEDRPWQCKCTSVKLDPVAGPTVVADRVQLTRLNGNRPCNHPKVASDGQTLLWVYGSNHDNQATVRTYVSALDEMCRPIAQPQRISANGNNNEGAPDITFNGGSNWTAGYLSTNNNDASFAVGLTATRSGNSVTIQRTFRKAIVAPSNIGRPTIVPMAANRSLFCAAKGDQRPPEDGVECAMLSETGQVLWRDLIAESDPDQDVYMNQPQLVVLGDGTVGLSVIESNGLGRNKNRKGSSMTHLYMLKPTDSGANVQTSVSSVGTYQAHATLCGGAWGTDGAAHLGVFDASITGSGLATLTLVSTQAGALKPLGVRVAGSVNGDGGYLANRYGQNPNTQGREFLRCIGDIANPGYQVQNGFLPNVKTFWALPYTGRNPGESKNALFLSLMPAHTTPAAAEPPLLPADEVPLPDGGSVPIDQAPDFNIPTDPPAPAASGDTPPASLSSGSCSVNADGANGGLVASLLVLWALVLVSRNRRRTP